MRTNLFSALAGFFLAACTVQPPVPLPDRHATYPELFEENPTTIVVLPPANFTNYPEATHAFYTTLFAPLINAGYYVIPPLATMQILRQEQLDTVDLSERSAEMRELFGADLVVHTYIQQWGKSFGLDTGEIVVEAEYFIVSAETGSTLFYRKTMGYCQVTAEVEGSWVLTLAASTLRTAAISPERIAALCSESTFFDLPLGPYSPQYRTDQNMKAGPAEMLLRWGE
ncbi:MAG: GNA1162 family protein [Bacteroides sp.]|jgi:hypothetical protein|nr:GNA1162 family protein [Bacteroides sp.]